MNLTQMSKVARVAIKVFVLFLIVYFSIYFSYPYIVETFNKISPTKEKPVLIYGKLPRIKLESLALIGDAKPKYTLSTKNGALPNVTPELVNVFQYSSQNPVFNAGQNAQNKALVLKFTTEDNTSGFSKNVYEWMDKALSRNLKINVASNSLEYKVQLSNINKTFFSPSLEFPDRASRNSKTILTTLGYLNDPFYNRSVNAARVRYGTFQANRLVETTTPLDYTVAKYDFIRDVFKTPIVGPRLDDSVLSVTVANSTDSKLDYLRINAHVWEFDVKTFGRYNPLPISEAWKKVSNHEGYITKVKLKGSSIFEDYIPVSVSQIFIDNIYLAYYDGEEYQKYLQPVYVFEGSFLTPEGQQGEVGIYYPAVHSNFLQ